MDPGATATRKGWIDVCIRDGRAVEQVRVQLELYTQPLSQTACPSESRYQETNYKMVSMSLLIFYPTPKVQNKRKWTVDRLLLYLLIVWSKTENINANKR